MPIKNTIPMELSVLLHPHMTIIQVKKLTSNYRLNELIRKMN